MDIRIGINNSGRELNFESNDTAHSIKEEVSKAFESGAAQLSLVDAKGNTYVIPTSSIAYVEIGTEESRRVGFVA